MFPENFKFSTQLLNGTITYKFVPPFRKRTRALCVRDYGNCIFQASLIIHFKLTYMYMYM